MMIIAARLLIVDTIIGNATNRRGAVIIVAASNRWQLFSKFSNFLSESAWAVAPFAFAVVAQVRIILMMLLCYVGGWYLMTPFLIVKEFMLLEFR